MTQDEINIIMYQDYLETKEKVENVMRKLGILSREHFKSWLRIQNIRLFELESYETTHQNKDN